MEKAVRQLHDPDTLWTDGTRLDSGGVAVGVVWYGKVEEVAEGGSPVITERRGSSKAARRERTGLTYGCQYGSCKGA